MSSHRRPLSRCTALVLACAVSGATIACDAAADDDSQEVAAAIERFAVADALVVVNEPRNPSRPEHVTRILLSDQPGVCARLHDELEMRANERVVSVRVPAEAFTVGTFEITEDDTSGSGLLEGDFICRAHDGDPPKGVGTLIIDAVDLDVRGRVDLTFGARRIQTAFVAKSCAGQDIGIVKCTTASASAGANPLVGHMFDE